MYRNEQQQREFIEREYEEDLKRIQEATDIEYLRQIARGLATNLRATRDHLADYQFGRLKPHADE